MQVNTFDVIERRKHLIMFKLGRRWILKHYFDNKEVFKELAENYDKDNYRFEFKTIGERNKALKLLDLRGYNVELVENLKGYVVKMSKFDRYAPVLKNSVAFVETTDWRIFLMKDLDAVEEALKLGAEIYEGLIRFDVLFKT
ncbi:MAG: hypothetical protein MUO26_10170 [Methanotrichaceae archaeon]|nr:hypothetical protein [Methanotrichaceae archaeon]